MDTKCSALERAFQLAKSGRYGTVGLIKQRLKVEGYDPEQVTGPLLTKQIAQLIETARPNTRRESSDK